METLISAWIAVGSCLALASLPGTLELALLTAAGLFPALRRSRDVNPRVDFRSTAIVVPAHDEEAGIAECVASLLSCDSDGQPFTVLVVADNCSDRTADVARHAGAEVLVRVDDARRGKGYALELAFEHLRARGIAWVAVVDADSRVARSFVREVRRGLAAGADAVQVRYRVANSDASLRTRLSHVAWLAFNVLRLRGRSACGLSVGILGNGFALTRETLDAVPYSARSVVEDLEYHVMLVRAGRRVDFVETTEVTAAAPDTARAMGSQRARWDGGRLLVARQMIPVLFAEALRGRWRVIEPLFELALLPLSMHVGLIAGALCVPWTPIRIYAGVAAALVALHVLAALVVGRASIYDWLALLAAPGYVVWKIALVPTIARTSRKSARWVRTERATGSDTPAPPSRPEVERRWRSAG